jgi:hypothetical protein
MDFNGQYLTYSEYKELGGSLDITPFNILEFEARQNIDKYTFGRLKEIKVQNQEVKLCILKLIGMIESYNKQEIQNKGVSSENIDGYSISYITPTTTLTETKNSEIRGIIKEYLVDCKLEDGTPYMYCGV